MGWFKRQNLEAALAVKSVHYVYMGDTLGGYRKGGYELHMQGDEYALGTERLCQIAEKKAAAIMCAERLASKCHSRFVARSMAERGFKVIHIVDQRTSSVLNSLN